MMNEGGLIRDLELKKPLRAGSCATYEWWPSRHYLIQIKIAFITVSNIHSIRSEFNAK
jgi:hypothetical protein